MDLPCMGFTFPTRIFCVDVSDFVTGYPCGVWSPGLTLWSVHSVEYRLVLCKNTFIVIIDIYHRLVFFFFFFFTSRIAYSWLKYFLFHFVYTRSLLFRTVNKIHCNMHYFAKYLAIWLGNFLTVVIRLFCYTADMTSIQNVLNNYK